MSDSPDPFAFDPVPSASTRHDGWTPERQRRFVYALSRFGVVSAAAECAGMTRKSAYALLKRAGPASGFARAWREAQAAGRLTVRFTAWERAVDGLEVPIFRKGVQVGTRVTYDNRLLAALLRAQWRAQGKGDGYFGWTR
jgi:hypothetical protein